MPEPSDPHNTFEVTVPPLFGQEQTFTFTFRPACPGLVVSFILPPFTIVQLTLTYQTLKISMGPYMPGPVDLPCVSTCTPAPLSSAPARTPTTPQHVSVGVSPIYHQRTPPRTLMSRGLSPVPFENLLRRDIAAFFASTQMQLEATQVSPGHSPVRLPDSDVISLTSSESDSEKIQDLPVLQSRTRARSPDSVAGNHWQMMIAKDPLVCPHLLLRCLYQLTQIFQTAPTAWVKTAESKCRKFYRDH